MNELSREMDTLMIPFAKAILEAALLWLWDLQEGFCKAYDSICHLVFQSGASRKDTHTHARIESDRADMFSVLVFLWMLLNYIKIILLQPNLVPMIPND